MSLVKNLYFNFQPEVDDGHPFLGQPAPVKGEYKPLLETPYKVLGNESTDDADDACLTNPSRFTRYESESHGKFYLYFFLSPPSLAREVSSEVLKVLQPFDDTLVSPR